MSMTIGRFSGLRPTRLNPSHDGDYVYVSGYVLCDSVDHLRAARQQLLGLQNDRDEEVVPVTWSADATYDGFYRVVSVQVSVGGVVGDSTRLNTTVTLQRLTGYANAQIESLIRKITRTNGQSISGGNVRVAIPSAASLGLLINAAGTASTLLAGADMPSATGALSVADVDLNYDDSILTYEVAPGDFYDGAALIEAKYGSTWYPVIGRSPGALAGTAIRWSNGLVRFGFITANGDLQMEVWNGSAWEAIAEYVNLGAAAPSASQDYPIGRWAIHRNSAERVIISTALGTSNSNSYASATFTLTRGHVHTDLVYGSRGADGFWPVLVPTSGAGSSTAITGGIRRTSDDANGNRWWVVIAEDEATNLDNDSIQRVGISPGRSASFGIGVELNGSSAVAPYRIADNDDLFYEFMAIQQRVIVR